MKIYLKNDETYEIKIPEEIQAEDFLELLDKLNRIFKIIKLSDLGNFTKFQTQFNNRVNTPKKYIRNKTFSGKNNPWFDTREKTLDLFQYAYHGTQEDKNRICKLMQRSWNKIQKSFNGLKKRYNLQAHEVGLTRWRILNESKNSNIQIPNWTIRSHTGIFDENGNSEEENGNN